MKMRIFTLLMCAFLFTMCKSKKVATTTTTEKVANEKRKIEEASEKYYTEDIRNDFRAVSEKSKNKFLKGYRATDAKYSILFFTQGYSNDLVTVKGNDGVVFEGKVKTNPRTGLAKNMRIVNTSVNEVFDKSTGKTIYITPELAQKYKFIYVMKNTNMEVPYKITFSNLLRPER